MALADNRLFVPWVDLGTRADATGLPGGLAGGSNLRAGRGGLAALDTASGKIVWQNKLPSMDFGAAPRSRTTSYSRATTRARSTPSTPRLARRSGPRRRPPAINSFPAVDGDTLLVGAGTTGFDKKPKFELVAYSLSAGAQSASSGTRPKAHSATTRPKAHSAATRPKAHSGDKPGPCLRQGIQFSGCRPSRPRAPGRSRSGSRTRATSCTTSRSMQEDAADRAGQVSHDRRLLQEEGPVHLPLHRPRTRRCRDEGNIHSPMTARRTHASFTPPRRTSQAGAPRAMAALPTAPWRSISECPRRWAGAAAAPTRAALRGRLRRLLRECAGSRRPAPQLDAGDVAIDSKVMLIPGDDRTYSSRSRSRSACPRSGSRPSGGPCEGSARGVSVLERDARQHRRRAQRERS